MKMLTVLFLLLASMTAYAQPSFDIKNPAMQKMMEEMQKYEMCMAKIQQSQFIKIQALQEKFIEEVSPLCASGNRDAAQQRAIKFGKEMSAHPVIMEIKKCGELLTSELAIEAREDMDFDYEKTDAHICDEI